MQFCQQFYGDQCTEAWFDSESPQQRVYVDAYWMMRTEVTNAQYRRFVAAGGYTAEEYWTTEGWAWRGELGVTAPSEWENRELNRAEQPVAGVSWYEAAAYANWLAGRTGLALRLPTEAEWEKAARGTDGRIYPWGDDWNGSLLNYCDLGCDHEYRDATRDDGYGTSAPVGSYAGSVSPYGALDMAGNVWEWLQDCFENRNTD